MKIEVGKKYVNRDGKVVTIVLYDPDNKYLEYYYPYKGDNGYAYTENGIFYVDDYYTSQDDLLEEYKQDENTNEKNETISKEYIVKKLNME